MNKFHSEDIVSLVGRSLISGIFLAAGFGKFKDRAGTIGYMKTRNLPLAPALAPVAGAVEIGSGLALISGYRPRLAATVASLFLIPTTLIFHDFRGLQGMDRQMQQTNFLKNMAIIGGLLGIVTRGSGVISLRSRTGQKSFIKDLREELPDFQRFRKAA
jgi:putative oxidoreductase